MRRLTAAQALVLAFTMAISLAGTATAQDTLVHNIGDAPLTIPANSTKVYVLTGTATSQDRYVHVSSGWHGTIVLRNLSMTYTNGTSLRSPIRVEGADNGSSATPVTEVTFVLDGTNHIENTGRQGTGDHGTGRACIQVDLGATAHFQAIDPGDDFSGTLCVVQNDKWGGAGIGALGHYWNTNENISHSTTNTGRNVTTHGGNIHISSGIYYCCGGHGAGIGGGFNNGWNNPEWIFYDGSILITGGVIYARCQWHAAGIGSGCPHSVGGTTEHCPHTGIVVLPPAMVTAYGNDDTHDYFPNNHNVSSLGLAGASVIFYCSDPNHPVVNVRTADRTAYAPIYADLSNDPDMARVCALLDPTIDLSHVYLGQTDARGDFSFHATLSHATTFFTDAIDPATGHSFAPFTSSSLSHGGTVTLPLGEAALTSTVVEPGILMEGYTQAEAQANAYTITLSNPGTQPITSFSVEMENGSPFVFAPVHTTLAPGQSVQLDVPLPAGLVPMRYAGQLLINGQVEGNPMAQRTLTLVQHVVVERDTVLCFSLQGSLPFGTRPNEEGLWFDSSIVSATIEGDLQSFTCAAWTYTNDESSTFRYDTIVAYHVSFLETPVGHDTVVLCPNELPYTHEGHLIPANTQEGTLLFPIQNEAECDSILELYVQLLPLPEVEIEMTGYSCRDGSMQLTATHNGDTPVTWSATPPDDGLNGQEHSDIIHVNPATPTTYTATTSLGVCPSSASIVPEQPEALLRAAFRYWPVPPSESHPEVELTDESVGDIGAWQWYLQGDTLSQQQNASFLFPMEEDSVKVRLVVTHATYECQDSVEKSIVFGRECELWVPNAFRPGSEDNPLFLAKGKNLATFEMYVFDRIGRILHHSDDIHKGWDGTNRRGHAMPVGSYVYLINYSSTLRSGEILTRKGTVTILK